MTGKLKSMRSPLGRVRGLGAAHAGTHHWWIQRLTSLALIPLSVWFIATFFIYVVLGDYGTARDWLRLPVTAVMLILFIGVGFHHAVAGLQVVIEDYIHCEKMKFAGLISVKFVAAAIALLGILTTLKILFGV